VWIPATVEIIIFDSTFTNATAECAPRASRRPIPSKALAAPVCPKQTWLLCVRGIKREPCPSDDDDEDVAIDLGAETLGQ
jgi:hypothetical protein